MGIGLHLMSVRVVYNAPSQSWVGMPHSLCLVVLTTPLMVTVRVAVVVVAVVAVPRMPPALFNQLWPHAHMINRHTSTTGASSLLHQRAIPTHAHPATHRILYIIQKNMPPPMTLDRNRWPKPGKWGLKIGL